MQHIPRGNVRHLPTKRGVFIRFGSYFWCDVEVGHVEGTSFPFSWGWGALQLQPLSSIESKRTMGCWVQSWWNPVRNTYQKIPFIHKSLTPKSQKWIAASDQHEEPVISRVAKNVCNSRNCIESACNVFSIYDLKFKIRVKNLEKF